MSYPWSQVVSTVGSSADGRTVREAIERHRDGRLRVTFEREGASVSHTFDMEARWKKAHGRTSSDVGAP